MVYIYIIQLEHNKYYVKKSNFNIYEIDSVIKELDINEEYLHFHKPIEIIEFRDYDDINEDIIVIELMQKYGVNNVRGGTLEH